MAMYEVPPTVTQSEPVVCPHCAKAFTVATPLLESHRLAKASRQETKLTPEGLGLPERCQCGNPIALSGPAAAHSLCVFCWPKEQDLTQQAIDRAARRLKELG